MARALVLPMLLPLVLTGVTALSRPALASPADYLPPRIFDASDPYQDVPVGDLVRSAIQLDPNIGQASFFANVVDTTHPDTIVLGLGASDASGTCQPSLEIVGGTQTTSWIVRNAGETTLPSQTTDPHDRLVIDPRLLGFQPTCYAVRILDTAGQPLDSATDATVRLVPVAERDLTLFASPNLLQEQPGHSFALHFEVRDPYIDAEQWGLNPLYDLDIALTPGPGVTLDRTHITTTPGANAYRPVDIANAQVSEPGWHYVDVDATAGNGDPWHGRIYLWNVGGPHPPATGDLSGRGAYGHYLVIDGEGDFYGGNAELWFVNRRYATTKDGRKTLPRCRSASPECLRYWYDEESGILQIGQWRGLVTGDFVRWRPALSSADDATLLQEGPTFFDGLYPHRMLRHWSGHRLTPGAYRYTFKEGEVSTYRFASGRRYTFVAHNGQREGGTYRLSGSGGANHITFVPRKGAPHTEFLAVGVVGPHWRPRSTVAGVLIRNAWYQQDS